MTKLDFGKNGLPDLGNFFKIMDYQPIKKKLDEAKQKIHTVTREELSKPFGTELDLSLNNTPEIVKLKQTLYKMDSEDLDRKAADILQNEPEKAREIPEPVLEDVEEKAEESEEAIKKEEKATEREEKYEILEESQFRELFNELMKVLNEVKEAPKAGDFKRSKAGRAELIEAKEEYLTKIDDQIKDIRNKFTKLIKEGKRGTKFLMRAEKNLERITPE